jgi:DNA-binding PadR family transcriptional regulator
VYSHAMATGEVALALLLSGPRHGYDLKRAYDEWFAGMRPLAFGQVYSTLSRLQRDGLIQVAHTETGDGPERVIYELTTKGRDQALGWLREPVEPGTGQADDLIRKILAAHRLNADPDGLMSRQRTAHLRAIRALEPAAGQPSPDSRLSISLLADHARLHLDADLRWLELAAERIRVEPPSASAPIEPSPLIDTDSLIDTDQSIHSGQPTDADQGVRS